MLFIGADHRGFELKQKLVKRLIDQGVEVEDLGNHSLVPTDDYVDYAHKVGDAVLENPGSFGVVLCGSGAGVDMVANKIDGIRCALSFDLPRAIQARAHEDANMIALPADVISETQALDMVKAFVETPFSGDPRHVRRLEKLAEVEKTHQ